MTDDLFLGEGNHKIVYAHPTDKNLCVKLLRTPNDSDFAKEMRYRRALGKRGDSMTLLTKYFEKIETNLGFGHLFERVLDFDGSNSQTMLDLLNNAPSDKNFWTEIEKLLLDFKKVFFEEKFLLAGIDLDNYLVQRLSPIDRRVRIIDNIGTAAKFPLAYYFEYFTIKRVEKYWKMFVSELRMAYGKIFSEDFLEKLSIK